VAWRVHSTGEAQPESRKMTPIPTHLGWTTHKPHQAGAPVGGGPSFNTQLQALLQKTKPPTAVNGPSRATIGHLHPGGMNEAAHHLLNLAGKH
jgi:hypothetical protein